MQQLHDLAVSDVCSVQDERALTEEENFIKSAIQSKQKHAKAKLLIM
jgi:hypothetical protein